MIMTDTTDTLDVKNFRKDVLNKLSYKGPSHSSKEAILIKIFKFYDLNASGALNQMEFLKSIAKIGVVLNSKEEMDEVFTLFADANTGLVRYKKFIDWALEETSQRADSASGHSSRRTQNQQKSIVYDNRQSYSRVKQDISPIKQSSRVVDDKTKQLSIRHSEHSSKGKTQAPVAPQTFDEAVEWAREKFRENQPSYTLQLALRLKKLDVNGAHRLSRKEIERELDNLKPHLSLLLNQFDGGDGFVNYAELIYCFRGTMSPQKIAVLGNIFGQLDAEHKQEILISYVLGKMNRTPTLSLAELKRSVDLYCEFQGITDGVFTSEDFEDFFGFVAVYFKNDEDFRGEVLKIFSEDTGSVRSSIKSRGSRREYSNKESSQRNPVIQKEPLQQIPLQTADFNKKSRRTEVNEPTKAIIQVEIDHVPQTCKITSRRINFEESNPPFKQNEGKEIDLILSRIRDKLMSKGPRGFLFFEKSLKEIDIDQECYVDIYNFKKVIKEHRVNITPSESQLIFDVFDENTGKMNYIEFVEVLKGEVSPKRAAIIDRVWNTVKVNDHETSYNELKRLFNVRAHPDIHNGRRFQEDISKELIESISCIQDLDGLRSEEINKQTFIQYLQTVSASIQDDLLFETIMTNVWKLPPANKIEDMYAGSKLKFDMNKKQSPYLYDHHRAVVSGEAIYQSAPFGTFKNLNQYYRKA